MNAKKTAILAAAGLACLFLVQNISAKDACPLSSGGETYYIDWIEGDDSEGGTCPDTAWKSLEKVNATTFKPGDEILLKADGFWVGQLWPKGSGAEGKPIKIGMYGKGRKPIISGMGKAMGAVYLYNQEYWEISDLEITNFKGGDDSRKMGVYILAENYGTIHHIHLKNLYVHSVNGSMKTKHNGGIFYEVIGKEKKTNFDDFLVDGCHIYDVRKTGLTNISTWWDRSIDDNMDWVPNTNVVIRNNWIEMTASNGLIIRCAEKALIEHNVFKKCSALSTGNAMYPFNCDDTLVQYNESYRTIYNPGDPDSGGFDSDWQCKRSIFQYNYSHDNDYGFILICNNGKGGFGWNRGKGPGFNDGTIVRYNITQNDNGFIFRTAGPATNTLVYNNTIYVGSKMSNKRCKKDTGVPKINWHKDWNGYSDGMYFYNNIIYNMSKEAYYDFGKSTNNVWEYNVFFGEHPDSEPNDPYKITDDPMFVNPGSGTIGIATLDGYMLKDGSPCIDSGKVIENNGGRDYFGNPLYKGKPDRGAHEKQ